LAAVEGLALAARPGALAGRVQGLLRLPWAARVASDC
jgi:hypothetical protein